MTREYAPPPNWKPPTSDTPSLKYHGESSTTPIYESVGRTLSAWEFVESSLVKLFQVLCETRSLAACRAYGTIESVFGRHLALRYAADEFFVKRDASDLAAVLKLVKTYNELGQFRNQVAHGVAIQPHAFGYFLTAPSYASRRRDTPYPTEQWGLGSEYFYRVEEIDQFRVRFEQMVASVMSMVLFLNEKYSILPLGQLHP